MRIKVLEVGDVTKEKTFFVLPLKYEADGKTQDKKLYSFNAPSYNVLKAAQAGQFYDVKLEKDKNGYWQWANVEVAAAGAAASGGRGGFETPEERARRQVLIVRQSCLAQAVIVKGAGEENADNITELAEQFEAWVMRD